MTAAGEVGATVFRFRTVDETLTAVATELAAAAEHAVAVRGRFLLAVEAEEPCLRACRHWAALTGRRRFWAYTLVLAVREPAGVAPPGTGGRERLRDTLRPAVALTAAQVLGADGSPSAPAAARAYARTLRLALELRPGELPVLDRVLLAHHDASVAPRPARRSVGGPSVPEPDALAHAVEGDPPAVTLSRETLARGRRVVLLSLDVSRGAAEHASLGRAGAIVYAAAAPDAVPSRAGRGTG